MAVSRALVLIFYVLCCYAPALSSSTPSGDFLKCLSADIPSELVLTQSSAFFTSVLASSIRNAKFNTPAMVWPRYIVTLTNASHVQATVVCARRHGVRLRVRSGGHDYEGLSYRSAGPEVFAVVDLSRLRSVRVDAQSATAWVDSGATIGELYYAVAKASENQLVYPAGLCPTTGVGSHLSGGGFGLLQRKYGLATDNVLDAVLVDAEGRLLDKKAMGRDVFGAIRGGGGQSFGIVLSWKVKLVPVSPKVTSFLVPVTGAFVPIGVLVGVNLVVLSVRRTAEEPTTHVGPAALAFLRRNVAVAGVVIASCAVSAVAGEASPVLCFGAFALFLLGVSVIIVGTMIV